MGLYQACDARAGMNKASRPFLFSNGRTDGRSILIERILDRCLLVAWNQERCHAAAGIDLDCSSLRELFISAEAHDERLLESLVSASERLAVSFGLTRLTLRPAQADAGRFTSLGYALDDRQPFSGRSDTAKPQLCMHRSLGRRQTVYGRRVQTLGQELGIPAGYGQRHRLALQPEAGRLTSIGIDVFGREQKLSPRAAAAWLGMKHAAKADTIELQAVSAWRSVSYQAELLRRKLERGLSMEEILAVSSPPGFSEHHTGRAIDITTPGFPVLEESFEESPAFRWLERHAPEFSFRLSFPRGNRNRLAYEPWHWCFEG